MPTKKQLLYEFESTLYDFWGEEPTKRDVVQAWKDYLKSVAESETIDKSWYTLTKDEKTKLYASAGL